MGVEHELVNEAEALLVDLRSLIARHTPKEEVRQKVLFPSVSNLLEIADDLDEQVKMARRFFRNP